MIKVHQWISSQCFCILVFIFCSSNVIVNGGNNDEDGPTCVPCDGPVTASNQIEGITCDTWQTVNSLVAANDDECYTQRLIGQHYCDCPGEAAFTCSCPEGTQLLQGQMNSLENTRLSCREAGNLPAIDGEDSCRVFEQSCCETIGGIDGTCTLCKARGNFPNTIQKPIFGRSETCGEIGGRPVVGEGDCHTTNFNTTIDEAAYCGCPRIDPPNVCNVCPLGQSILESTVTFELESIAGTLFQGEITDRPATCRDIGDIQPFVVSSDACRALRLQAIQSNCCGFAEGDVPGYIPPVVDNSGGQEDPNEPSSPSSAFRSNNAAIHTTAMMMMIMAVYTTFFS